MTVANRRRLSFNACVGQLSKSGGIVRWAVV